MNNGLRRVLVLAVALVCLAPLAQADTIGPSCSTCQGSTYTLLYDPTPIAQTASTVTFRFTYIIDTSGFNGSQPAYIQAVGVHASSANISATLIAAPGGVGLWDTTLGSLNNNGCGTNPGQPFACSEALFSTDSNLVVTGDPGGVYTWVFDITMDIGSLLTGPGGASIKAEYVDANGNKIGPLLSESITLTRVSEPALLSLLGLGSVFAIVAITRSRKPKRIAS